MKDEEAACLRESRPGLRVVVCWQIIHNTSSYPLGIYHLVGNNERKNLFSTFTNKWIDNLTQLCRGAAVFLRKIMIIIIVFIIISAPGRRTADRSWWWQCCRVNKWFSELHSYQINFSRANAFYGRPFLSCNINGRWLNIMQCQSTQSQIYLDLHPNWVLT